MKIHLVNKAYGTLTSDDGKGQLGRIACIKDPMQWLGLQLVKRTKRGVTCKRCLRMGVKSK